jgi:iron complex transport system permease protein
MVVVRLASFGGRMRPDTMILAGVIVGAILAAGISLMKYMADEQVSVLIFWLMGSLASRNWDQVIAAALAGLFGLLLVIAYGRDLDILACGDRSATALGIDASRTRRLLLIGATIVAAVCVSVSGIIGFVGLIIPHLMRSLTGPGTRRLAISSFLAGAGLLLAADTISRVLLPQEVPVGVLTALLGGPFFCYIFRRRLGKGWGGE